LKKYNNVGDYKVKKPCFSSESRPFVIFYG